MKSENSSRLHVVVGSGAIGSAVARQLAETGATVRVITRSGTGPQHPQIELRKCDASNPTELMAQCDGAVAIYNCANPPYHRWATDWPPLADSLLSAAQHSGAVLATASNLYGYGPTVGAMTEETPLAADYPKAQVRIKMWRDALSAHEAGRIRAVEVRGSDYVGPGSQSHLGDRAVPKLLRGKKVSVLGDPDQPHTWTYTEDMAHMLVVAASDERAWGRAWHAPSNEPRTQRQALADMAAMAGVPEPRVSTIPRPMLRLAGLFSPVIRELPDVSYQFEAPFIMDSTAAQETFRLQPTPWSEVLQAALAAFETAPRSTAVGPS